jgi:hypothetical protein
MRKLTVTLIALLALMGLYVAGCSDDTSGGGNQVGAGNEDSSVPKSLEAEIARSIDPQTGYTGKTAFVDEFGNVYYNIADIKSDATGAVPPTAPTFARANGSVSAPRIAQ